MDEIFNELCLSLKPKLMLTFSCYLALGYIAKEPSDVQPMEQCYVLGRGFGSCRLQNSPSLLTVHCYSATQAVLLYWELKPPRAAEMEALTSLRSLFNAAPGKTTSRSSFTSSAVSPTSYRVTDTLCMQELLHSSAVPLKTDTLTHSHSGGPDCNFSAFC